MSRQSGQIRWVEARLECLRLAVHHGPPGSLFNVDQALERADRYFGWVTAEPPGPGPEIPFRASRKAPAYARKPGR